MKNQIIKLIIIVLLFFIAINNVNALNEDGNLLKTQTKDEVIYIKDSDGNFKYSWTFNKDEYEKNEFDFDLTINFSSDKKSEIEKGMKEKTKKKFISFNHEGKIPSKATIKIPVKEEFKDGVKLKLYSYDEKTKKIELIDSNIDVINGFVTFEIDYCTNYFLSYPITNDFNKTSNNGFIIVSMIIIIVGLIGYTLYGKN